MALKIDVQVFNKNSQCLVSYSVSIREFFIDCENIKSIQDELYRIYKIKEDYLLINTINDLFPTLNINVVQKYPGLLEGYDTSEVYTISYIKDSVKQDKLITFDYLQNIKFKGSGNSNKFDSYSVYTDQNPYILHTYTDSQVNSDCIIIHQTLVKDNTVWVTPIPIKNILEYTFLIKCLKGVILGYYNEDHTCYAKLFFEKLSKL